MIAIMSMISTIMVMISIMAAGGEAERVAEAAAQIQVITLRERQHQVLSGESRWEQGEIRSNRDLPIFILMKCLCKCFVMIKRWPYNWASLI